MDRRTLLEQIRKEFGVQAMFLLGENERLMDIKVRPSGSLLLDLALGGGYPQGRLVELSGKEKSGKTTLLCLAIAEAQKLEPEKENVIIDLEHTFNPVWAKVLGVDVEKLFITQPDTPAEKVFDMVEYLLRTKQFAIVGLDSIAGLISKDELEQVDWEKESRVGGTSKLNAKAMRKLISSGLLSQSDTTLVFINQLRDKIGGFSPYGTPTETPGGRSLKHSYSQQLEISIGEYFTKGTGNSRDYLGQQVRIKVAKNKIAAPFRTATIDLYYEHGMDKVMETVNVAREIGVLVGTNWLKLIDPYTGELFLDNEGKEIKFNGAAKAKEALVTDIKENNGQLYLRIMDYIQSVIRR